MNQIINAKKKVNKSLSQLEMIRQYYSDRLQDLVYKKIVMEVLNTKNY